MTSCNENRLDVTCTCSSRFGEGKLARIYDISSGEYVCCGNVSFDVNTAVIKEGGLIPGAASLDDPRCSTWWNRTISSSDTIAVPLAGPTAAKLTILQEQVSISNFFPSPDVNGVTKTYDCSGIISEALPGISTEPKYLVYQNPNSGESFIESVQCIPVGNSYQQLKQTPFAQNGNFAIYSVNGCSTGSSTCTPLNGLTGISIGKEEFRSSNYTGYITPDNCNNNTNCKEEKDRRLWMIGIIVLVVIFIIIIIVLLRASGGDKNPCPSPYTPLLPCPPPPPPCAMPQPPPCAMPRPPPPPPPCAMPRPPPCAPQLPPCAMQRPVQTTTTTYNVVPPYAPVPNIPNYYPTVVPTANPVLANVPSSTILDL